MNFERNIFFDNILAEKLKNLNRILSHFIIYVYENITFEQFYSFIES